MAGLDIHRRVPPKDWKQAVENLPEELREEATDYLKGIAACMRGLRDMAIEAGCSNFTQFERVRREAKRAGAPGARAWVRAGRPEFWRGG